MKKRRITAFLLILCMLAPCLILTSCRETEKEKIAEKIEKIYSYKGDPSVSPLIASGMEPGYLDTLIQGGKFNTPLEKLSGAAYFDRFCASMPWTEDFKYYGAVQSLSEYNSDRYGVEHIHRIDFDHMCVIGRLLRDEKELYSCTMFERKISKPAQEDEESQGDEIENWEIVAGSICFFGKPLSFSDFSSINPGDSMKQLIKIDDTFKVFLEPLYYYSEHYVLYYVPYIYYLLTDGVMYVELDRTADPDNPTVKAITFYAYGAEDVPENLVFLKGENRIQLS